MRMIIDNLPIVIAVICIAVMAIISVVDFIGLPAKKQISKVKEWLLYAVTYAEEEIGSGKGQIKLRMVYDLFVANFPAVARIVKFETFSEWVDEALDAVEELLGGNSDDSADDVDEE